MATAVMKLQVSQSSSQQISRQQENFLAELGSLPVKKMDDLVQSQAPAVNALDRKSVELFIFTCIGDYLNFIGAEMKDSVVLEVTQMMIDNHPHITIEAIKTFFYECKRGAYGFHYNKMDGSKLLMWYDKFVTDYYQQLDDMEYAKHLNTKGDLANPLAIEDEDGQPIDYDELLASFRGKTKEEMARERKIADIRRQVCNENIGLYDTLPVEEADKRIEEAIIAKLKEENLITF